MLAPSKLLPWLLGGAVGLGGVLQGLHWRSAAGTTGGGDLRMQLQIAQEENELLKRENQSLRSLAQGGGEVAVPQPLIDRIEKEFGLRFLSGPVVHRIATEELRDRIGAAIESRFGPSGIDDRQEAYRLIGWLGPEDDLLAMLTAVRSVGARGWFDDVTGEAWVTDRFQIEEIPDQASLIRLVSRILLHQHFPPPPAHPGDDAARAREALHHGAALGAEARFMAANAREIGFMPMNEMREVELLFASLPSFIQDLSMFPSIEGKALADTLYVQGEEILLNALREPPQTTRAIFLPAEPGTAPGALDLPPPPEEAYLIERAGQLGLRLWLQDLDDPEPAATIPVDWKNDLYQLVPDGEASLAVVWDIEFQSPEAAAAFETAALSRLTAMARSESPARTGEILEAPGQRHLLLLRPAPDRVRFLNSRTPGLADRYR